MGNRGPCVFCQISKNKDQIIAQEGDYMAFHDISKGSAQEHILICTKQHVQTALQLSSPQKIDEMKQMGKSLLQGICQKKGIENPQFRFGFHLPPYNSVNHIHLHCFLLPFQNILKESFHYGYMLYSIESTKEKWKRHNQ